MNADEYGTVRVGVVVQELCSVFFYALYDLLMTAYSWSI